MCSMDIRLDLPAGVTAIARARDLASHVLRDWGFHDHNWLDDAVLVVTELVANAVRHAGGCRAVTLRARDDRVTISAVDTSPVHPRPRRPDNTGGYGLHIVEALTTRWGVEDHQDGKHVWADLAAHPHRPRTGRRS